MNKLTRMKTVALTVTSTLANPTYARIAIFVVLTILSLAFGMPAHARAQDT